MTSSGPADVASAPYPRSHVLLADGTGAEIRALDPADREELVALHESASEQSIYLRFFSSNRAYAGAFVKRLCRPTETMWSLVAVRNGRLVGLATAMRVAGDSAEVAFIVDETLHGVGIATALMGALATWSTSRDVHRFSAEVLAENLPMLRVFHDIGFELTEQRDHEVVRLELDLRPRRESLAAADARERRAELLSLRHLLEPRTVAVLGVSRSRGGIGREVVENVVAGGFGGDVFALGQSGLEIPGVSCVSSLDELPRDLDLVVLALPGPEAEAAVRAVAERGTQCCVILTAGMAETGADGQARQSRIVAAARRFGMRVVGPNCFGVVSNLRDTSLDATFGLSRPGPGRLAVGSQSGGVGIALLDAARERGTGLACFVSLGNKADVSGNDLLATWTADPDVGAAALYLESFHDPRKFARLAATFSRVKPLLVVYGGTSAAGTRAGASHTAAHATPARVQQALFRAAGVVEADSVRDLVDTAALLTEQPLPRGRRLGVVSNAGGLGIVAADAAYRQGLTVPLLSDELRARLSALGVAGAGNPVDLGAAASPRAFSDALRLVAGSGEIDALLVVAAATAVTDLPGISEAVETAGSPDGLPLLSVITGAPVPSASLTTRFANSDDACRSLGHAVGYAEWRSADEGPASPVLPAATRWTPGGEGGWVGEEASHRLLDEYGIGSVRARTAVDDAGVAEAVRDLGLPLVAKAGNPAIVHKTDRGLVHAGLQDATHVRAAAHRIWEALGQGEPVLLQEQLDGPELAVGIVRDPAFGPLVMVASGGVGLELWDDQVFLMPPLRRHDVRRALAGLRTWPLLTGFRGSRPRDTERVAELVEEVGRLALEHPEVVELDLNPVIVTEHGPVCVDAKLRMGDLGNPL